VAFSTALATVFLATCSAPTQAPAPSSRERFYYHNGVKIRFTDTGRGGAVVFIHGFGASLETWRYIAADLEINHRLIALDLKGHGFSDRPPDDKYSLHDHAEIVLGLIRHLNLKEVILVGHSFGSVVAVATALQATESPMPRISGLVVIGGALEPEHLPIFLKLLRAPLVGWLSVKLTTASFRTRVMLRRAFYDDTKVTNAIVELYAGFQRIPGTEQAMVATAGHMVPENLPMLRNKLATLRIPVLNLWGERDVVVKRPGAESVCKLLARCRLVVIPDSGHVPQEETPDKIVPLLREFLDGLSRGSGY
jgi:pimeloyl-ACP methyl ester carboxylesterase